MSYEEELLSDDAIIEILSWLPPETLIKFKSVCKSWYYTINDAKFVAKHHSHFGNLLHQRIVIAREKYTHSFLHLKLHLVEESNPDIAYMNMELKFRNPYPYNMIGSCNGIICYASFWHDRAPIQLCYPSTRWTHLVPSYLLSNIKIPSKYGYGVGFDHFDNDYKVLKFVSGHSQNAIYSVKTKSWKIINTTTPRNTMDYYSLSVFLQGFIHWLVYTVKTWNRKLMIFDVCYEDFGEMQLPEIDKSLENNEMLINVVKGLLCLMVEEKRFSNTICHVWTMKEYGVAESWIKQHTIVLDMTRLRSIELTVDGNILVTRFHISDTQKLYLYNPETGEYRYVGLTRDPWSLCSLVANL